MRKVKDKTTEQVFEELKALRQRVAELEKLKAEYSKGMRKTNSASQELLLIQHNLSQRLRELSCLHRVARLVAKPGVSLEKVFKHVVNIIADSFQYTEIACARIIFGDKEFKTDNFRLTEWKQSSDIKVNGRPMAILDVCYLEKPGLDGGHFSKEKRALIEDITNELANFIKRRLAEEAMQESELRYRTLFNHAPVGIGIATYDGHILAQNRAMLQLTGYSEEEIRQINLRDTYQNSEERTMLLKRLQKEGFVNNFEVALKHKDGTPYYAGLTITPLILGGEEVLLTVAQDITERKLSEERYKTIIQTTLDGFFLADLEGKILDVNDAYCNMVGYSREELLSMTVLDIDVEFIEAPEKLRPRIFKDKEAGGAYFKAQHRCKNGRIIDVAVSSKYLDNKPGFFFCFHRDITEQKKAREKLRESKEFSDNLIASMKDGFSVLNNRGIHINVNDALCQMTGFTREELIGVGPPHPYWPEEEYQKIQATFNKTLKGEFKDFELTFKKKNGERFPVIVSPSWLKDKEGNVISYFATIKDITNMKKMQEQVIEAEAQAVAAQESEKMKTELLSMVSHELRTPLASIKGFANTLLQPDVKWSEDEERDFIHEIDIEADRLSSLVDDLLDMSSIEAGTLTLNKARWSISKILKEAKPMIAEIAKQHELKVKIASKLPLGFIDRERMIQVLSNLVDNATKFSPKGSQITIEAKKSQGKVVIGVADQGRGMAAEEQGKLFDRFYQAKKITSGVKRGTGLGLAICKGLVEAQGGKIWLDSQEGRGSTFYFSLPICKAD